MNRHCDIDQHIPSVAVNRQEDPRPAMTNEERLQKIYEFLKRGIVPQLRYSQSIYEDELRSNVSGVAAWLDVGCGHHLLPAWREQNERELLANAELVVGIDFDLPSLAKHKNISNTVQAIADHIPFRDDCFDMATANMVVEHLDDPRVQFAEINRVLKPGAKFVFHTPNETGYFAVLRRLVPGRLAKRLALMLDGREADDVFEIQYKANREDKIRRLASVTNFEVEEIRFVSSDAVCALIPPLAAVELLWIKLLMARPLRRCRTNLIVTLKKLPSAEAEIHE